MLLAIPFIPNLPRGYDKLVSAILRHGKHPLHSLHVISEEEHEDGAFALAMKLKDSFGRQFSVTLPKPPQPETPLKVSNRMFQAAMDVLKGEAEDAVLLYFDPTWRPTKARWLDEFQSDYYLEGAPVVYGHFQKDGDKARITGPVAISRRFFSHTLLANFLPPDAHWREYLAWEMVNVGVEAAAFGKTTPAYIRPFDP